MSNALDKDFVQKIANNINELGYQVTLEPSKVPNRKMWQYDPPSVFRGLKYKPDLLVESDEGAAVLAATTLPFLMGGIIDARSVAEYFGAPAIICVPDDVVSEIPESVLRFAGEESVSVASLSTLALTLASIPPGMSTDSHGDK